MRKTQKHPSGFTIIEVMIVLAIAGLIMLIVFMAVPALQRTSRNTQRKNDVQQVIGALQEYQTNNQGKLPTGPETHDEWKKGVVGNMKLSFYDPATEVFYQKDDAAAVNTASNVTSSNMVVVTHRMCIKPSSSTGTVSDVLGGSPTSRNVVVLYYTETSSGGVLQCQDI